MRGDAPEESAASRSPGAPAQGSLRERLAGPAGRGQPIEPGRGDLVLRGRVVSGDGPAAGAVVVATRGEQGDSLSERGCECGNNCGMRLLSCGCGEAAQQLVDLVTTRAGEVVPVAEAVTNQEGEFELTGLAPGEVALWAEHGESLVGFVPEVFVGEQEVEILVVPGRFLRGTVVSEDEVPLPGVSLTAVHKRESKFFDTLSDSRGGFFIGPVPQGDYRVVAWDGRHLADQEDFARGETEGRIVLTEPRTLTGRVLLDDRPASGAEVVVTGQHRTERVSTDADGRFSVSGLRLGDYNASARLGPNGGRREVSLDGREPAFVELHLRRLGTISGTVRDGKGAPLAGATVAGDWSGAGDVASVTAETGDDGTYLLELHDGRWRVRAKKDRYLPSEQRVQLADGALVTSDLVLENASVISGIVRDEAGRPIERAQIVAASVPGKRAGSTGYAVSRMDGTFDLDLTPDTYEIRVTHADFITWKQSSQAPRSGLLVTLKEGAVIAGVVIDTEGEPIRNAAVSVHPAGDADFAPGSRQQASRRARSRSDGVFELSGLEEGPYLVRARVWSEGESLTVVEKEVTIEGSERIEIVLQLERGADISGVVVEPDGRPVAEIGLRATPAGQKDTGRRGERGFLVATTDAQGRFTLSNATADEYVVSIDPTLHEQSEKPRARPGDRNLRITARPRAAVRGRVVDAAGEPIRDFSVDTTPMFTDDGVFRYPIDRNYRPPLQIVAEGYASELRHVEIQHGVVVDLGDIVMSRGRQITGVVLDEETGLPLAGAKLLLDPGVGPMQLLGAARAFPPSAVTTPAGRFVLSNVPEREAIVAVMHDDYQARVETLASGSDAVTVRLSRGATLVGRVSTPEGEGVETIVLAMRLPHAEEMPAFAMTEPDGTFRIGGLSAGTYQVGSAPTHQAVEPVQVEVPASGEVRVELRTRGQGVKVRLAATNPNGTPAMGVPVLFPGTVNDSALIDPSLMLNALAPVSEYDPTFESVPPGPYTVLFLAFDLMNIEEMEEMEPRYVLAPITVGTEPEQTIPITIQPGALKKLALP